MKDIAIEGTVDGRFFKRGAELPKYSAYRKSIRKHHFNEMWNTDYDLAISWGGRKKFPGREYYCESGFFYGSLHINPSLEG